MRVMFFKWEQKYQWVFLFGLVLKGKLGKRRYFVRFKNG